MDKAWLLFNPMINTGLLLSGGENEMKTRIKRESNPVSYCHSLKVISIALEKKSIQTMAEGRHAAWESVLLGPQIRMELQAQS